MTDQTQLSDLVDLDGVECQATRKLLAKVFAALDRNRGGDRLRDDAVAKLSLTVDGNTTRIDGLESASKEGKKSAKEIILFIIALTVPTAVSLIALFT